MIVNLNNLFALISIIKLIIVPSSESSAVLESTKHARNAKQSTSCTSQIHRPRYHFSPAQHWMNDPNGMVYYEGVYHLFFQHHPNSSLWGPMHWGHAISRNLVTWEELDIALAPDQLGDFFSGSGVVDYRNTTGFKKENSSIDPIVLIYTSASGEKYGVQRQSLAYSLDKGLTFQKYYHNPILEKPNSTDFRDPKVFYHGASNKWIMALAAGIRIEFYSSSNLLDWVKESEFGEMEGEHGGVWECPDLMRLRAYVNRTSSVDLYLLIVSINPGGPNKGSAMQYFIGNFSSNDSGYLSFEAFEWKNTQWLDWGMDSYAGVTFSNEPNGKYIYIAWMNNWNYANKTPTRPWRGQMTIPRELGLQVLNYTGNEYRVTSNPVPELISLRHPFKRLEQYNEFEMLPQTIIDLTEQADFQSPLMEIKLDLQMANNPQFSICAHNSVNEETCFGYNGSHWYLDRSKSGNFNKLNNLYSEATHAYAPREIKGTEVAIRMFLDVSSIEVFVDAGLTTMTALHFPSEPFDKLYIQHWSKSSTVASLKVKQYKLWALQCWYSGAGQMVPVTAFIISMASILLATHIKI